MLLPKCLLCLAPWVGLGVVVGPETCGPAPAVAWIYPALTGLLLVGAVVLRPFASVRK